MPYQSFNHINHYHIAASILDVCTRGVGLLHSTRDLICDVINYCTRSCNMCKISVNDKNLTENREKEKR